MPASRRAPTNPFRIQHVRETCGLTRKDLARLVARSPSYVGRVEAGKTTPSDDFLFTLARALGCDGPEELLRGSGRDSEVQSRGRADAPAPILIPAKAYNGASQRAYLPNKLGGKEVESE